MKNYNFLITFSILCLMLLGITGCNSDKKPAPPAKQGQELIDSLRIALSRAGQDTNRVNALNGLSEFAGWRINQNDTCIAYAQKALTLAKKINYKFGMARAYNNLGHGQRRKIMYKEALESHFAALNIFKETGNTFWEGATYSNIANDYMPMADYPNALKYLKAAIKPLTEVNDQQIIASVYQRIADVNSWQGNIDEALKGYTITLNISKKNNDKNGVAYAYVNSGSTYTKQGNYPEALKNCFLALKIFESLENKDGIANCNLSIGQINSSQGNYQEALQHYTAALKIYESFGDNNSGITGCYTAIGGAYSAQGNYPEALKNFKAALEISESIGDKFQTGYCYGNIGETYQLQGNYPEALKNFMAALEIAESIGDKNGIAYCYNSIGTVYTQMNNIKEGKAWLQKSLVLSRKIGIKDNMKNSYLSLTKADSAMGNFKSSFENYKLFTVYKDSLNNEDNTKKLTQTAMQYEFDKKEALAQAEQEKKNILAREALTKVKSNRNLALAGVGVFMLVAAFLGVGFYQKRKSNSIISLEKQKSDDLLLNILPEEVAEELKERGATTARQFDEVSILFTDFVSFTRTAEKLTPQQLVQELNECFTAFDNIIERNGLEKIKTIGDAYMAVCGLPTSDPKHAQRTVQAALEIRDFIADRHQKEQTFEIRIGVNSGSVVAGIVGVKKFAYDIWGDTVNTAARMESSGEPGKVNISETTYELVKEDFNCTYRGKIEAKGKGEIDMYFVESK